MTSEDDALTPGEIARAFQRIEAGVIRIDTMSEERHEAVLRQISDVRHRVVQLELRDSLGKEFMERISHLFTRVDALEKQSIAHAAVAEFKKYLLGGSLLGATLVALQIYQLIK
jgi:hypothetical protein